MTEDATSQATALWTTGDGRSRAARTAEILLTLSRFGFGELIERGWWARWLPGAPRVEEELDQDGAGAVRLRRLFEALGPSFVKIGQLLALHAGALPRAYREELSRLLDDTLPLPFPVVDEVLTGEYGRTGGVSSSRSTGNRWPALQLGRCTGAGLRVGKRWR